MKKPSPREFIMAGLVTIALVLMGTAIPAKTADNKTSAVFMWSVQGPKSKAYLLGSIHVFKKTSYPLDVRIEKAYKTCPRVVFEADLKGTNTQEIKDIMLKQGALQGGKTLQKEISPKTYAMLKERLEADGLTIEQFNTFRPWYAALSIASVELKRRGFTPEYGIDSYFYTKASADKKNMIYLETAKQQLDILSKSFSGNEEDLLRQTLEELSVLEKASSELEQAWKQGDADQVEKITRESLEDFPEVENKLFTQRNKAWIDRISKLLNQKGDTFIIVGAGHLVGSNGVLEMLKAKGFTVIQQ